MTSLSKKSVEIAAVTAAELAISSRVWQSLDAPLFVPPHEEAPGQAHRPRQGPGIGRRHGAEGPLIIHT